MKKTVFIVMAMMFCAVAFCKKNDRAVEWNGKAWILKADKSQDKKLHGSKIDCGEGIYFLYEDENFEKYLVDEKFHKLSEKKFMHVGHFYKGKTIVSGYQEEAYETDRIYDVITDTVSEPLENLWVYCAFVEGFGAFSYRNKSGSLMAVLLNMDLQNSLGIEFDEFCELDFENTIWHFRKNEKDYFIDKNGKVIKVE